MKDFRKEAKSIIRNTVARDFVMMFGYNAKEFKGDANFIVEDMLDALYQLHLEGVREAFKDCWVGCKNVPARHTVNYHLKHCVAKLNYSPVKEPEVSK